MGTGGWGFDLGADVRQGTVGWGMSEVKCGTRGGARGEEDLGGDREGLGGRKTLNWPGRSKVLSLIFLHRNAKAACKRGGTTNTETCQTLLCRSNTDTKLVLTHPCSFIPACFITCQ